MNKKNVTSIADITRPAYTRAQIMRIVFKRDRKWSQYQCDFFTAVCRGRGHLMLEAVPGSGKSTSVIEAVYRLLDTYGPGKDGKPQGWRVQCLSFNKAIKEENATKLPEGVFVQTLNGAGRGALDYHRRQATGGSLVLDERKSEQIAKAMFAAEIFPVDANGERITPKDPDLLGNLCKGMRLFRAWNLNPASDSREFWDVMHTQRFYPYEEDKDIEVFIGRIRAMMREHIAQFKNHGLADHDDCIWLVNQLGLRPRTFGVIFVDECQDLNAAQLEFVEREIYRTDRYSGRVVFVGDAYQAIYSFRGAMSDSMERIKSYFRPQCLPLSVSYRCSRAVVAYAQQICPDILPADNAPEGSVTKGVEQARMLAEASAGDFVISRKNAPLARLVLKFLRQGKAAKIAGRADATKNLIKFVERFDTNDIGELCSLVAKWGDKERAKLAKRDGDNQIAIEEIDDTCEVVYALSEGLETCDQLIARIESMFADEIDENGRKTAIILTNTHRAKGLEAERVWLLGDTYKPGFSDEERNLLYVGITRAMRDLFVVVDDKDQE